MSRTDELRRGGAKESAGTGGGDFPPSVWIKWRDEPGYVEGEILKTFETRYGLAATIRVDLTENAPGQTNVDGERTDVAVKAGDEVCVGLWSAVLEGKVVPADVGKVVHVGYLGWCSGKANRFRDFAVLWPNDGPKPDYDGPEDSMDYGADEPF